MLYLIAWLTDCALILFIFSATRILAEQHADPWTIGTLGAVFFLASAISNTIAGGLSDRIGRRIVSIAGGVGLVASLSVPLIFTDGAWRLYVAYICVGVSVGHIYPSVIAWLSQGGGRVEASRRFLRFGLAFNLGILGGQIGGGWLYDHVSSTAPLQSAIGLAFGTVICLCLVRERKAVDGTVTGGAETVGVSREERISARRFIRLAWLANFSGMFSMSTLWFLFPTLAVSLGIPAEQHGVVLGVGRAAVIGIYALMHVVPAWHHRFRYSVLAQLLGLSGMILVCVGRQPAALACGVVMLSVLLAYNYFASLFYNRTGHDDRRKGAAFGLNEAFLSLGASGGSLLGGWASTGLGERAPFQLAAILIAASLAVQIVWFSVGRRQSDPEIAEG
jgi:predicted MFS family arabinose efflux permease